MLSTEKAKTINKTKTMLTEEQMKGLKPGDEVIIRGTYVKQHSSGDIVVKCNITAGGKLTPDLKYFHPMGVSLPPEKPEYDPCRKFKKGDIVMRRIIFGRTHNEIECLINYTVKEDEEESSGNVIITDDTNSTYEVKAVFLELVTPAEKLESFGVRYSTDRACAEVYHHRYKNTVAVFYQRYGITQEQAEARAEEECERLNAEYRKQQNL